MIVHCMYSTTEYYNDYVDTDRHNAGWHCRAVPEIFILNIIIWDHLIVFKAHD